MHRRESPQNPPPHPTTPGEVDPRGSGPIGKALGVDDALVQVHHRIELGGVQLADHGVGRADQEARVLLERRLRLIIGHHVIIMANINIIILSSSSRHHLIIIVVVVVVVVIFTITILITIITITILLLLLLIIIITIIITIPPPRPPPAA
jgi:hypothetical protein